MLYQQRSFCKTFILKCFKHFKKCSITSNAFTWFANYYSSADIKRGVDISVALQAKYFKNSAYQ